LFYDILFNLYCYNLASVMILYYCYCLNFLWISLFFYYCLILFWFAIYLYYCYCLIFF